MLYGEESKSIIKNNIFSDSIPTDTIKDEK